MPILSIFQCNSRRTNHSDQKIIDAGDPNALVLLGSMYYNGVSGLPKDFEKAFELFSSAAELGIAGGHHCLAIFTKMWSS